MSTVVFDINSISVDQTGRVIINDNDLLLIERAVKVTPFRNLSNGFCDTKQNGAFCVNDTACRDSTNEDCLNDSTCENSANIDFCANQRVCDGATNLDSCQP